MHKTVLKSCHKFRIKNCEKKEKYESETVERKDKIMYQKDKNKKDLYME